MPMVTPEKLCLGMACVYSFFGFTLLAEPSFFWGPKSPMSYWTVMDDSGVWFGRTLGLWMAAVTLSPYYAGIPKLALCKVYLPINIVFIALFSYASFGLTTTGPGKNALLPINMWWTQLPIAATFLLMNIMILMPKSKAKAKAKAAVAKSPTRAKSPRLAKKAA